MVYTGPSQACATCKQRRIKCDLTKPGCKNCLRKGVTCPGYKEEEPFRFQDETDVVVERVERRKRPASSRRSRSGTLFLTGSPPEKEANTAQSFFCNNYSLIGRGQGFITDFFGLITLSLLPRTDQSSALFESLSALAQCCFALWSGVGPNTHEPQVQMGKALFAIQQALKSVDQQVTDETLAAVLLLNIVDSLSHWSTIQKTGSKHQAGVLALITHRGDQNFQSNTSRCLWLYARHSEIDLAIRECRQIESYFALPADAWSWSNHLIELDTIAIEIANVNCLYSSATTPNSTKLISVLRLLNQVDEALKVWAASLPTHFQPTLTSVQGRDSPTALSSETYRGHYEVYQSFTAATYWSFYRNYRLLVQKLIMLSYQGLNERFPHVVDESLAYQAKTAIETLQELVDDTCASVPFYLTSHNDPTIIKRLEQLELEDDSSESSSSVAKGSQKLDKMRNTLAMGGWRVGAFLEQILEMLSGEDEHIFQPLLRPGQQEWLERQLKRIMKLHSMDTHRSTGTPSRPSSQSG